MPKSKAGENKKDYLLRCMGYSDMQKYDSDQRYAICNSMWEENKVNKSYKTIIDSVNSIQKSVDSVMKAEEGDKRVIFGKPATYTSGKWKVDTDGNGSHDIEVKPVAGGKDSQIKNLEHKLYNEVKSPRERDTVISEIEALTGEKYKIKPQIDDDDETDLEEDLDMYDRMADELVSMGYDLEDDIDPDDIEDIYRQEKGYSPLDSGGFKEDLDDNEYGQGVSDRYMSKSKILKSMNKSYKTVQKALAGTYDNMITTGATTVEDEHSHGYKIDVDGTGSTTSMIGSHAIPHTHNIKEYKVSKINGHIHEVV